ncbi:MAG TPA: GNAT family N-acetyltransferase [Polyangia bacterium]|jgi:predicted acetyltransferase
MEAPEAVTLDAATADDAALLFNLLELYIHDLSGVFPEVELGADGRFGYEKLPLYWSEPERRFPFLVKRGGQVAGFALATSGSPVSPDPDTFDVAEFFVLRRHRRSGVGRVAAALLWRRLAGPWTVRVSERNVGALPFWASAISTFTRGRAREARRADWRVYSFDSRDSF